MNEALKDWANKNSPIAGSPLDFCEAWLRAFVDEVEKRAAAKCSKPTGCSDCLVESYGELTEELLGDK